MFPSQTTTVVIFCCRHVVLMKNDDDDKLVQAKRGHMDQSMTKFKTINDTSFPFISDNDNKLDTKKTARQFQLVKRTRHKEGKSRPQLSNCGRFSSSTPRLPSPAFRERNMPGRERKSCFSPITFFLRLLLLRFPELICWEK